MSSIADVFAAVRLQLDHAGFEAQAVAAGEKAGATVGTKMSQSLSSKLKSSVLTGIGIGGGIGAFNALSGAISGAVGFLGDAVKAAETEQTSMAALTTALKVNDKAWDGNSASIEKVIESRLKLGFTANDQRASLAVLVAITQDHTAALRIERDAMDLSRLKGIDLASSSLALGKAYEGNFKALKALGINVAKGTTGLEALGLVEARVAGQADAFSTTTEGALQGMGAEFEKLQADIGRQLLPILTDLAKFARDELIPDLEAVGNFLGDVGKRLGDLGQAWATVGMDFGSMGQKIHDIADRTGSDFQTVKDRIKHYMLDMGMSFDDAAWAAEHFGTGIGLTFVDSAAKFREGGALIADTTSGVVGDFRQMSADVVTTVAELPAKLAASLRNNRDAWRAALVQLATDAKDTLTTSAETAALLGALHGKELARGLADSRPLVRADAEATQLEIVTALQAAGVPFNQWGMNIGTAWALGVRAGLYADLEAVHEALMPYYNLLQGVPDVPRPLPPGGLRLPGGKPLPSFDTGSRFVPETGLALVHRGEAIYTAAAMADSRPMQPAAAGSAAGGISLTIQHMDLHGIGSDVSPAAARSFGRTIMDELTSALRDQRGQMVRVRPVLP